MSKFAIVISVLAVATFAHAEDPAKPEQCVEQKITVEKLKQDIYKMQQQLMQLQFPQVQQAEKAAQAEEERLKGLLPKAEIEPVKKEEKK